MNEVVLKRCGRDMMFLFPDMSRIRILGETSTQLEGIRVTRADVYCNLGKFRSDQILGIVKSFWSSRGILIDRIFLPSEDITVRYTENTFVCKCCGNDLIVSVETSNILRGGSFEMADHKISVMCSKFSAHYISDDLKNDVLKSYDIFKSKRK